MAVPVKSSLPLSIHSALTQPALERSFGGTALFSVPVGSLYAERVSALLQEQPGPVLWLRVGPEDRDPAVLLLSLARGLEEPYPGILPRVLEGIRQQPGTLYGWGPLFSLLASDLSAAARSSASPISKSRAFEAATFSLVIEHLDQFNTAPKTLALLWEDFLPLLPSASNRLLTRHSLHRANAPPAYVRQVSSRDLRLDERACLALAMESGLRTPARMIRRLAHLTEGREVALVEVFAISRCIGDPLTARIIDASENLTDLLTRLARAYLDTSQPGTADLLALSLRLEHLNAGLIQAALGCSPDPPVPFFQRFDNGWMRLRCIWHEPLRSVIRPGETQGRDPLVCAAHALIQQGAFEQAIPLLLDLNEPQEAAQVILQILEQIMDLCQWETLAGWLKQIPEAIRQDWPWLVYAEGELSAIHGQARAARRAFSSATRLFRERRDSQGVCQSLLTESCLAAWQNDLPNAQEHALQARAAAEAGRLDWYRSWTNWQLGSLAVSAGHLSDALACFDAAAQAAADLSDPHMSEFIHLARQLARQQVDQQAAKAQHVRAYYEADQAERDASARLNFLLDNPASQSNHLRELYGWSRTPLFLKLPPLSESGGPISGADRLMGLVRDFLRLPGAIGPAPAPPAPLPVPSMLPSIADGAGQELPNPKNRMQASGMSGQDEPAGQNRPAEHAKVLIDAVPTPPPEQVTPPPVSLEERVSPEPQLTAYLLGSFRVTINETPVEALPIGRGRAVFAYLLTQHGRPVPREVIMEAFWPDVSPESARNSLNVAIYSLRQALKPILEEPVVLFQKNTYQINPHLPQWLDVEAFERFVQEGRKSETSGQLADATRSYEKALSQYQGDLLADFPYEEWVLLDRERLRVLYLETLDRLSLIYFSQEQYAACASLCLRMLAHDACREDAHCRLMRCYARQGQSHLALRQYQVCVEALRSELNTDPAAATRQLYEKIRRHESV